MGWVYNLKEANAPTHAPRLIAICLAFSVVAFLAVVLRFYVRFFTRRSPWVDDYAALSSAILGAAYSGITIAQTRWGQALDPKFFPPENLIPFSKVQYAGGPVYTLALLGFKMSLLASYLRIGGFNKSYSKVIYAVMALCACNQLIFTCVISFACSPIAKQWDSTIPGHCIDTLKSYYAIGGTSLGFDILIIALPLPILITLRLQRKQKIVLIGIFALGFFVTIIQIIRIFTIKNLKTYTNSESIIIWSTVEVSLGVIITCVPTYAPLFHAYAEKMSSSRSRNRGTHTYGSQRLTSNGGDLSKHTSHKHRNRSSIVVDSSGNPQTFWAHDLDEMDPHHKKTVHTVIHSKPRGDTESEEHIIKPDDGGIHAVTEVRVESHRKM